MPALKRHRGYVLLVVLIVLTMAATLLVTVGQLAINQARVAITEEAALQRKWAIISTQKAVLPHAEQMLAQAEAADETPINRLDRSLHLGDLAMAVSICDEQAKANINQLLERADDQIIADRLRAEWSGTGMSNSVRLRPLVEVPPEPPRLGPPQVIRSFGQIFDAITPDQLSDHRGAGGQITCFGSGAINLLRADEPALHLMLSPSLTRIEIRRLLEERDKRRRGLSSSAAETSPAPSSSDAAQSLFDAIKLSSRVRGQLAVTDHSTCHSVWIVVKDRQRVWYNWFVLDESMPRQPLRSEFRW